MTDHITSTLKTNVERINAVLNLPVTLPENIMDDAAKLVLMNSQYQAAFELANQKFPSMNDADVSDFMLTFNDELLTFGHIITDFELSVGVSVKA